MTRKAKLFIGAAVAVIGTGSLAFAASGDKPQGERPRAGGGAMMIEMFRSLDSDGDGAVSQDELAAAGPAAAFAQADANGDGALEADELTAFHDARQAAREARRQQMMLQRFDADNDGKLSLEELQAGARGGPQRLFDRLDADDDGVVTAEELAALEDMRPAMREGGKDPRGHMGRDGRGDHGPRGENGRPPMPGGAAPAPADQAPAPQPAPTE